MGSGLENLDVLNDAQQIADETWSLVSTWDGLARDVVGVQLARAIDSVGANIAEAFGRFHYADKIRFLYYARGSLFEAKFWIARARARGLMPPHEATDFDSRLTEVARKLNALVRDLRFRSQTVQRSTRSIHEPVVETSYSQDPPTDDLVLDEDRGLVARPDD